VPTILSLVALLVSAAALGLQVFDVELQPYSLKGNYDFSTPEESYKSWLRMNAPFDREAMVAYRRAVSGFHKKSYDSLVVHKKADYRGETLLFNSMKKTNGTMEFEVVRMAKDPDSGMWVRAGAIRRYDINDHDDLRKQVGEWNDKKSEDDL